MYHTQEKRGNVKLKEPLPCNKDNAWFGVAWYFWYDTDDAYFWGLTAKKATGYFDIYSAVIQFENVLDTVFNEDHYLFWKTQVEKAKKVFVKSGCNPTLKQLNDYFIQKGVWNDIEGIMFQNIANSPEYFIVKDFQYKKRIQLAVYNLSIISTFAHHLEGKCI